MPSIVTEKAWSEIRRLCASSLDAWTLRAKAMPHLQKLVPFDCAWSATADPATLLATGGVSEHIPEKASALFLRNELLHDDVNKFGWLGRQPRPVNTLYAATRGNPERSPRYRDILRPFGMGDELRVALRDGGLCWGYICLHRSLKARPFADDETSLLHRMQPLFAAGLRNALLLGDRPPPGRAEPPAVVTLADDLSVVNMTPNAAALLDELRDSPPGPSASQAVRSVAVGLLARERGATEDFGPSPRLRVRTRARRWLTVHALRLSGFERRGEIAVVLERARLEEMAPLLLSAYGLTERERGVALFAIRGMSNKAIARALSVAPLTVQQHLKAVFEKTCVHSRGELRARVMAEFASTPRAAAPKVSHSSVDWRA